MNVTHKKSQPIEGICAHPLDIKCSDLGSVMLGLKKSDVGFSGFGEAYFSTVYAGQTKGWILHKHSTANIVVPYGKIKLVFFDERPNSKTIGEVVEFVLSRSNYLRLTVPPKIWMAFQGLHETESILLHIASLEHDPAEMEKRLLEDIPFKWAS